MRQSTRAQIRCGANLFGCSGPLRPTRPARPVRPAHRWGVSVVQHLLAGGGGGGRLGKVRNAVRAAPGLTMASSEQCRADFMIRAGCPIRTARTLALSSRSTRLSTAMLDGAAATTLLPRRVYCAMSSTTVVVLPVPAADTAHGIKVGSAKEAPASGSGAAAGSRGQRASQRCREYPLSFAGSLSSALRRAGKPGLAGG